MVIAHTVTGYILLLCSTMRRIPMSKYYHIDSYANKHSKWSDYHEKNSHVYDLFCKYTFQVINSGAKHCSPWLIIGRIRWETAIKTTDVDFKINNDYIAFYSRLFMHLNPSHDGFFHTKPMKGE